MDSEKGTGFAFKLLQILFFNKIKKTHNIGWHLRSVTYHYFQIRSMHIIFILFYIFRMSKECLWWKLYGDMSCELSIWYMWHYLWRLFLLWHWIPRASLWKWYAKYKFIYISWAEIFLSLLLRYIYYLNDFLSFGIMEFICFICRLFSYFPCSANLLTGWPFWCI